jgi:hypothetical protein
MGPPEAGCVRDHGRDSTRGLATLMSLIDYATEHIPEDPDAPLEVPIPDLAHRVLQLYWRQVRPFDGRQLRQSTQLQARIPRAALDLRAAARVGSAGTSLAVAAGRAHRPRIGRRSTRSLSAWPSSPCSGCSDFQEPPTATASSSTTRFCTPTSRAAYCVIEAMHRAHAGRRSRSRQTRRAPQACIGDDVGRGRSPHESLPGRGRP